jgi:hypothetical protein
MKTLFAVLVCLAALSGCAVVPAYGPPAVYAPAIVVPYGGYGYRGGYGYGYRGYR